MARAIELSSFLHHKLTQAYAHAPCILLPLTPGHKGTVVINYNHMNDTKKCLRYFIV